MRILGRRLQVGIVSAGLVAAITGIAGAGVAASVEPATGRVEFARALPAISHPVAGEVVLGRADGQYSVGYGTARPATLSLNSLCANTISGITWSTWGGPEAKGRGVLCAPAGSPESGGPVILTATDRGTCAGRIAYRQLWLDGKPAWKVC
ncbi:hypothetical protein FOV72_11305 [Gordonia rubripertincta]|uniref:hypothetical protein n=1 Tax=Gordonia rubripertincta TaxID=36822 RepID=UPI00117F444B|nr:hypothetical protein [Gordonia rubripertincta]TSD96252.1 hypothetical protein FOV72_11305 [Gordonia rubripertincta]